MLLWEPMNLFKTTHCLFLLPLILLLTGFSYDRSPSTIQLPILWQNSNDPYLTKLRQDYHLDDLVQDAQTDYEKILLATHWVHTRWQHNGWNHPPVSDPLAILELVQKGERFACVEYSIVLAGVLNSLAIPTRVVSLKMADVETRELSAGHVVVESYLTQLNKWIMIDAQMDAIPTASGLPLNAIEFQQAIHANNQDLAIDSLNSNSIALCPNIQEYFFWIAPYLYYLDTPLNNRFTYGQTKSRFHEGRLMLVPLGAKNPTVFQKDTSLTNFLYTHSVETFYKKPV